MLNELIKVNKEFSKAYNILSKYNEFRYIKLGNWKSKRFAKAPIEKEWKKTNNYPLSDRIYEHILEGNNYGIATGYGNLIVIDLDDGRIKDSIVNKLPDTFTVRTGRLPSSGYHLYYKCNGLDKSIRLRRLLNISEKVYEHVGEVQSYGKMVVGAGSVHPSGNVYKVFNETDIVEIDKQLLYEVFDEWILKRNRTEKVDKQFSKLNMKANYTINIGDIIDLNTLVMNSDGQYQGSHPIHGSSNGYNFSVNVDKNVWYCFRHNSGGGILLLIAVIEGIIDCSEATNSVLKGELLDRTIKVAESKYRLKIK